MSNTYVHKLHSKNKKFDDTIFINYGKHKNEVKSRSQNYSQWRFVMSQ